jgi:glutamyl-tRNA reductase
MIDSPTKSHFTQSFKVLGINHKTATLEIREKFSLNEPFIQEIYQSSPNLFILNTCNRSEIYGTFDLQNVKKLWMEATPFSENSYNKYFYLMNGQEALRHLFTVACGLDSRIIGDFEISGQLRKSISKANKHHSIDPITDRLSQFVFSAIKRTRSETNLSSGAASIGYAAVQYAKQNVDSLKDKKILLYGTGKIGSVTCSNLLKHTNSDQMVLINRTKERAEELGKKYHIEVKSLSQLDEEIKKADIIIVATGAGEPTITKKQFENLGIQQPKIIIDLSVPRNVESKVKDIPGVQIAHVDHLSELQCEAMTKRKASIPKAMMIINDQLQEFNSWLSTRHLAPTFSAIKEELEALRQSELSYHKNKLNQTDSANLDQITVNLMNKIARQCINHLKENHQKPSNPVKTIESIFGINQNS